MRFIIDSNEYIFAFGPLKETNARHLLDRLVGETEAHTIRIPRTIFEADAFIAAYAEWTGADILVTKNRHFLSLHSAIPFKVLTSEKCLKLLIKTSF